MTIEFRTPTLDRTTGGNLYDRESAEALDRRNHEVAARRLRSLRRQRTERFRRAPVRPEPRRGFGFPRTPLPETGTAGRRSDFAAPFSTLSSPAAMPAGEGEGGAPLKIEFRAPTLDRATGAIRCDRESAEAPLRRNHEVAARRFRSLGRQRTERLRRAPVRPEPRRWFGFPRTVLPETGTAGRRSDFAVPFPTLSPPAAGPAGEGEGGAR